MASSSSSKAAETPEWKRNLDATPVEELCNTQKDLIRGVSLLDDLVEECAKSPPVSVKDMIRVIKLVAGFLEVKSLGIRGISMLSVYPEKDKLVRNTIATLDSDYLQILRNSSSDPSSPTDNEAMPNRLCLLIEFLLSRAEFVYVLAVRPDPGSENDAYWESLRDLSCGTPPWAVACLNELRTSPADGDLLLKQVGSNLTVDQLLAWSKVIAPVEHVAKYHLSEDPMQMVLPMLDKVTEWLETFANAPPADNYSWYLARRIVGEALDMTFSKTLMQLTSPPGAELMEKIEQKWEHLMEVMFEMFAKKLVAARAAVQQDPVHIAWYNMILAGLMAGEYEGQGLSQGVDFVVESRAAAQRAKPWLPPAIYKPLNIQIKALENLVHGMYQGLDDANKETLESTSVALAKLDECCNVCKATGREFALKCCSQCRKVYYCSKECQKKDWKQHRKVCKSLASEAGE